MAKEKRFIEVHKENGFGEVFIVFIDKVTGVNYLFRTAGYAGGLTPLLDKDGKPVITPPEELAKLEQE